MPKVAHIVVALIAATFICFPGQCLTQQAREGPVADAGDQFVVGPRATLMPKGAFLLIRKGRNIGAVRFTSIEPSGEFGVGKASYESYFQEDGTKSFLAPGVIRQMGWIDLRPLVGIGRLAFQLGQDRVDVGPWSFPSSYPGRLDMWPYRGDSRDYGYEFAPTSATSVTEIDATNKRLKWFRFNSEASMTLPLSGLQK
jgi:hypothetical protein